MTQFIRPASDAANTNWGSPQLGSPIYRAINDATNDSVSGSTASTPDDNDYVRSDTSPTPDEHYEVSLGSANDPNSSSNHVVKYRYQKSTATGRTIDLTVELRQGSTIIASWTHLDLPGSWLQASQTLTAAQADSITNYADLRLRFHGQTSGSGPGKNVYISWAEVEIPDVVAGGTPVVTIQSITAQDAAPTTSPHKSSLLAGGNSVTVVWRSDQNFQAYKVKVVPATSSLESAGTQIGTANGSTNVSGGSGTANTDVTTTLKGADVNAASSGEGDKLVKIFVQNNSGVWSTA